MEAARGIIERFHLQIRLASPWVARVFSRSSANGGAPRCCMFTPSLSLNQLESHLWEAANILRGPVDAADFKSYVFPLLFFKRISDVHDEEHRAALEEFAGDEKSALFPENYRFQVPVHCHWRDVRAVTVDVGQALQTAMRGVEQANPHTLYGIFGDAQWTNKDRLSDALLRDLIEHFFPPTVGEHRREDGRTRAVLRIPDQEVRRHDQQEGGRVLHAPFGSAVDGQHP